MSDRAAFLGIDSDDDFCVLTIQGQSETLIGDLLLHRPDDFTGCSVNETRDLVLPMDLELKTGSLAEAIALLVQLRQPESIATLRVTFSARSKSVMARIRDELFPP
jgi:hypothetical protein